MNLLEDGFDADYDIENEDGIMFGDVFYMNYFGINVFFYVCGLDRHRVRIFELAKYKTKFQGQTVEAIVPALNPTKAPVVVMKNNCWTKSDFWVETNKEGQLEIPVNAYDPLFNKALSLGIEYPLTGTAFAVSLSADKETNMFECGWPAPKKIKKKNKNFFEINA